MKSRGYYHVIAATLLLLWYLLPRSLVSKAVSTHSSRFNIFANLRKYETPQFVKFTTKSPA
jgi:hypothetical protein